MGGRFLDRLLARFGYGLVSLRAQDQERRASALAIGALEDRLDVADRHGEALEGQIHELNASHDEAQQQLWSKLRSLRASLGASRRELKSVTGRAAQSELQHAADLAARAEAETRLWGKLATVRSALDGARAGERRVQAQLAEQARSFAERNAAEAQAHAEAQTGLWGRLDLERRRVLAAAEAAADAGARARDLQRQLRQSGSQLAWHVRKLEAESARRAHAQREVVRMQRKLASAAVSERAMTRTREKLDVERANTKTLKRKLQSEQKRLIRLEAEIKEAKARERAQRLEAERARGEEQRLLSEIALASKGVMGARTGDPSDAALEWLSRGRAPRRNAGDEAAEQFRLGRAFQAQGSIGLAAACYRAAGPSLEELLVQQGPDGDRISGPDFIVIGAARAGTTWLKKCLAYHPQVFVLSGEHHYFSTASHQPPESYVGRFANAHTRFQRPGLKTKQFARPSERLYGEKSTTYLAMPQAQIDLCAALFPKARLICLVREPVARVWSHLKHYKVNDALRRLDKLSDLPPWMELEELIRQTRYEEHLIRWARRFDPEQILLVDFDRIASEPQAVHAEVLAHIGAQPAPAPDELDEFNRTERLELPKALAERLTSAFEQERFDVPYLRAAMQRAADMQRTRKPGEAVPRRRSVRPAG